MQALGLIEVVGYPPAVEAADAALKAANVTLLSIAKADAGIMTVEIIGDVGAVTSAVDAGARSAAKIGLVRARHVIPRVESDLIGKIIPCERVARYSEEVLNAPIFVEEQDNREDKIIDEKIEDNKNENSKNEDNKNEDNKNENSKVMEDKSNQDKKEQNLKSLGIDLTTESLNKQSNARLRGMIEQLDLSIPTERLNSMKKQELIKVLLDYKKE